MGPKNIYVYYNFNEDPFLYLMALNKRNTKIFLKRKLNPFETLTETLLNDIN